ncbi:MAG: tetratricopeptide repeat protein, partial [Ignavibacteriales bacterium]|nr:tetratricopeptide repeat protein [Ignavibacteriales bacterium]
EGQGKYQEAAILKEQAVAKDSLFTAAVSDLSYIHRKLGNDSLALYYHNRVLPLLNRVTDREKFYILSFYYGPSFELNYQKAFQNIQQLVLRYPNSAEGYATLGHLAMYVGDTKTAIEANQRSLEIDSVYAGTVFNNMGYTYALSNNADEALKYYQKSKKIRPTYYAIDSYIAQSYWIKGQYDSVEQKLKSIFIVADLRRKILTYSQMASFYYFRGRLEDAAEQCKEAIKLCQTQRRTGDEAYFHFFLDEIEKARSNSSLYKIEMSAAERLSASPYPELPLIGASYALNGDIQSAENVIRKLNNLKSKDPYFMKRHQNFIDLVEGEIFHKQGLYEKAKKEFESVEKLHSADPYYLLAQKGIAQSWLHKSDSTAIRLFENILSRKGEIIMG